MAYLNNFIIFSKYAIEITHVKKRDEGNGQKIADVIENVMLNLLLTNV